MILLRASPLVLLLLLFAGTSAMASSPSTQITNPDAVAAPAVNVNQAMLVSPSGGGTVPGCPPAVKRGPWKVPADGGKAIRTFVGPMIFHAWWNNGHPSVIGKDWNHGVPSWGQQLIKFKLPGGVKIRTRGMGGEGWDYVNNSACRHNLRYEFRHGDMPAKSLSTLIDKQLVVRLN